MEHTLEDLKEAVGSLVDDMILSDYSIRFNLVLQTPALTEEMKERPGFAEVIVDGVPTVYSLKFPLTGVKRQVSGEDVLARGYLAAHLPSLFTALDSWKSTKILRLGENNSTEEFYENLANLVHSSALRAMPADFLDCTQSCVDVTKVEHEEIAGKVTYVVNVYYSYMVYNSLAIEKLPMWLEKLSSQQSKFTVPFVITVAVPLDDMTLLFNEAGSALLKSGLSYRALGNQEEGIPLNRNNQMLFFGKSGDCVTPHGLFQISF